jgi:Putative S-adenosyl-L-methionine-dependent methyltransferase
MLTVSRTGTDNHFFLSDVDNNGGACHMLVRKYIQQRLQEYYAQPLDHVVGSLNSSTSSSRNRIPFRFLFGEYHWNYIYGRAYRRTKGQWLTPSELFTPYYSQCIARWMVRQMQWKMKQSQPSLVNLEIVELGGGRGTNAMNILDYIHESVPDDIYPNISSYTVVDYSQPLLDYQQETFSTTIHASKFSSQNLDLCEYASSTLGFDATTSSQLPLFSTKPSPFKKNKTVTIVFGLEILDNLPHDKIRYCSRTGIVEQTELVIVDETNRQMKELFVPLSDPILQNVLQNYPIVQSPYQTQCYWIPTVACGIIRAIFKERPEAFLLLADFDSFVNAVPKPASAVMADAPSDTIAPLPAVGDPIVTNMNDVDLTSYLQLSETATDILFPTNFHALAAFLRACRQPLMSRTYPVCTMVQKQSEFLQIHGPEQVKSTTSWWTGFSPMVHDFVNCSILSVGAHDPLPATRRRKI